MRMLHGAGLMGIAVLALAGFFACGSDTNETIVGSESGAGAGNAQSGGGLGVGGNVSNVAVGTGGAGNECAGETIEAELVPLDMYITLDSSGSMLDKTGMMGMGVVKWEAVTEALTTFFGAPESDGIGAALGFFPERIDGVPETCTNDAQCGAAGPCFLKACTDTFAPCSNDSDCSNNDCADVGYCLNKPQFYCLPVGATCIGMGGPCTQVSESFCYDADSCLAADYAAPYVDMEPLPGNGTALSQAMADRAPQGGTPISAALEGALDFAESWQTDNPTHRTVVLLATDGQPTECETDPTAIAQLAASSATADPPILTFVLGIVKNNDNAAKQALDEIADGGGTGEAFFVDPSGDVGQDFLDALEAIRTSALACEYLIPQPSEGDIDYGQVNVEHTPAGEDTPDTIFYVASAGDCDPTTGGWYYDVDPAAGTPTQILMCPATCELFQSGGEVQIRVGCATVIAPPK